MAESPEHEFISTSFIDLVHELSRSQLFGYREADRRKFDFAAVLETDRSRQVVGQTLTHHAAGIEKDLNQLLFAKSSELPVYIYANSTRNEGRIREVLHDARASLPDRVALVRLLRYPSDFDADDANQRFTVEQLLRDQITEDLLLNVVFGRLTGLDIMFFLDSTGMPGLLYAALEAIAAGGFLNMPDLARRLGAGLSTSTLRPRLESLVASGMLERGVRASLYRTTPRARIFLKICSLLDGEREIGAELAFILDRLGLGDDAAPVRPFESLEAVQIRTPDDRRRALAYEVAIARQHYGSAVTGGPYPPERWWVEGDFQWIGR